MSRKEERRGLDSIEDSVDVSMRQLEDYIKKNCKESLNTVSRQHKDQQKKNNKKKKTWEEKLVWIFQMTNRQNLTREYLDNSKKGKP